jgi:hypothetical protein
MNIAAPQKQLDAESTKHGMLMDEKNAATNARMADAQASRAKTAAQQTQTVQEYLKDASGGGVRDVLQQMETGRLQHVLTAQGAKAYLDEGRAILREQIHRRNEEEAKAADEDYDRLNPDTIAEVEAQIERNGGAVQRAGAVALLRAVDPAAAKEARKYAPQFYELIPEEGLPGAPAPSTQRKVPTKRVTRKQQKANIKKWKEPVADRLREYMENPENDTDIDAAITTVIDEWLPEALAGRASSNAPQGILASEDASFDEYRESVIEEMREYLTKHFWRLSDIAREENPEATRKVRPRRARPNAMGKLIQSGVDALFD